MYPKGNLKEIKRNKISETEEATPTKLVTQVHVMIIVTSGSLPVAAFVSNLKLILSQLPFGN